MAYDTEAALKKPLTDQVSFFCHLSVLYLWLTFSSQSHTITITPPSASITIESDEPKLTKVDDGSSLRPQAYIFPVLADSPNSTPSDSRSMCETPDSIDPWDMMVDTHTAGPEWHGKYNHSVWWNHVQSDHVNLFLDVLSVFIDMNLPLPAWLSQSVYINHFLPNYQFKFLDAKL